MTEKTTTPDELGVASCSLCGGKGHYMYDHNHGKPCEQCCKHEAGWWELTEHHAGYIAGADNGCCRAGCGQLRRELHQANKCNNRFVEALGRRLTLMQWSRISGIGESCIRLRLRRGWDNEAAVTLPNGTHYRKHLI